jgi:hypothetical protein
MMMKIGLRNALWIHYQLVDIWYDMIWYYDLYQIFGNSSVIGNSDAKRWDTDGETELVEDVMGW